MADEFSPEEKLLRLIRGKKRDEAKPAPEKVDSSAVIPPATGTQNMKYSRPANEAVEDEGRYFKFLNLGLVIILVVIIVFYAFDIVNPDSERSAFVRPHRSGGESRPPQQPAVSEPQGANIEAQPVPFSTYAEAIGKRELFKPPKSDIVKEKEKTAAQKKESGSDKLKSLSLIGIIGGERPQAIIEDKKDKKTYFLNKGQTISDMKVEDILGDRIILDFDGEKFDLVL